MAIEIEKKYHLTEDQFAELPDKLRCISAEYAGEDFEINEIYGGEVLSERKAVLRLRLVEGKTILTFKRRIETEATVKKQIEHETGILDAQAMREIIENLGLRLVLIYEKRRRTWKFNQAEIVLDELPFGFFMEIEGEEAAIERIENLIGAGDFTVEYSTYPQLTKLYGERGGETFYARFTKKS